LENYFQVYLYAGKVKMPKIFEVSNVKKQQNCEYFTVGHFAWTIPVPSVVSGQFLEFFHLRLKILAEIVDNAENFGNFVGYEYAHVFISICLFFSRKGTKNIAYMQLFLLFLIQNSGL
jgi:hypothetical protein